MHGLGAGDFAAAPSSRGVETTREEQIASNFPRKKCANVIAVGFVSGGLGVKCDARGVEIGRVTWPSMEKSGRTANQFETSWILSPAAIC
jgi:hypothetical protein